MDVYCIINWYHLVGEIFTVLGNMFIGISSTVIGYLILTQISYFADNIVSPVVPTLGFLIISFVIGSLFMNVYGMAVDSILLCYIADSELNSKSGGAKSIPPSLKEFLDEYKWYTNIAIKYLINNYIYDVGRRESFRVILCGSHSQSSCWRETQESYITFSQEMYNPPHIWYRNPS